MSIAGSPRLDQLRSLAHLAGVDTVHSHSIGQLIIGTTHFVNAVVENDSRRLSKVAVIRLSKTFTRDVPPFADFPPGLEKSVNGYFAWVDGGLHIDGSEESSINEHQIIEQCHIINAKKIKSIVVAGVNSAMDVHYYQEAKVRDIILRELPTVDVVCSSEVSRFGLLERENAAILNASILQFARQTIRGFQTAMKRLDLRCELYLTQNDGSLISSSGAVRFPIRTFSSGPTNSMRGAAYLARQELKMAEEDSISTMVLDVGGTTTDIGVLLPSGFPRQSSAYATVAGVRVNFGMPHVTSIGLGGGSLVHDTPERVSIGPTSVGRDVITEALVFGGNTLTTTDIAVAAGADIGDCSYVEHLGSNLVANTRGKIRKMVESAIDNMKISPNPTPLILVGGGSVIIPADLEGVSRVIIPTMSSVANAIGAAISQIAASVDLVKNASEQSTAELVELGKEQAIRSAIKAGADPEHVTITDVDVVPLQYVANQVRIIVKAVGDLLPNSNSFAGDHIDDNPDEHEDQERVTNILRRQSCEVPTVEDGELFNINTYRPKVLRNHTTGIHEWIISEHDLRWIADGCYVLGCGGGGSPYSEFLRLRTQLRDGYCAKVIDMDSLRPDARIYWGGYLGSPQVFQERLTGPENWQATEALRKYLNHDSFDAFMTIEIGGACGLLGLVVGSDKNYAVPTIDGDWMGK